MRHKRIAAACAFAVAACSSGTGGPEVGNNVQTETLTVTNQQYDLSAREEKDVMETTMLAPIDSVWRALPGVFLELDIEPGTVDQQTHVISNTAFIVRHTLGGVQLSHYVDCGSSISGPSAMQMKVTLSLTVQVVSSDSVGVSKLRSQLDGWGVSEATSSGRVHCATTGQLESRIARMVNDEMAHRAKKTP